MDRNEFLAQWWRLREIEPLGGGVLLVAEEVTHLIALTRPPFAKNGLLAYR